MDDIVRQALAKWPNVPHCYGWLALDARGGWRMRDERTQASNLPGDRIVHPALLGFINRNYLHDEQGRWYFQNGPQRVYVNLEATPYIARTDPQQGFVLHTDALISTIDAVWLTERGELILQGDDIIAQVDDRDLAQCINHLEIDGKLINDTQLLNWLTDNQNKQVLHWRHKEKIFIVDRIACSNIENQFVFMRLPSMV